MTQFYNIIASTRSRNSYGGYGKINLVLMDETEIINIATEQVGRRGGDLTQYTDIVWVGVNQNENEECEFKMSREWVDGEEFEAALSELTGDGYIYEVFKRGEQDAEFLNRAIELGVDSDKIERILDVVAITLDVYNGEYVTFKSAADFRSIFNRGLTDAEIANDINLDDCEFLDAEKYFRTNSRFEFIK